MGIKDKLLARAREKLLADVRRILANTYEHGFIVFKENDEALYIDHKDPTAKASLMSLDDLAEMSWLKMTNFMSDHERGTLASFDVTAADVKRILIEIRDGGGK